MGSADQSSSSFSVYYSYWTFHRDGAFRGGAAGTAGTALAGPLFMAIRPHPQLNFCGLGLESTLSFVRVFTFYQNKGILLENNGSH